MMFLYKIHSGYDGFYPERIPDRLKDGKYLRLGWKRYLDVVESGDEVWIYFRGPHAFDEGIYLKGRVGDIDLENQEVTLKVFRYETNSPLTDAKESKRAAEIVEPRYRQVFLLPTDWEVVTTCDIFTAGGSCSKRKCDWCSVWKALPKIEERQLKVPPKLDLPLSNYVPAYWTIPSRCFIPSSTISDRFHKLTQILGAFKTGNVNMAYPLARGIFELLVTRNVNLKFDCIVPIPLSPDKAKKGEIHRTRLLARELSRLIDSPVKELLSLEKPVSKRKMMSSGFSYSDFMHKYAESLAVDNRIAKCGRILIVDDVCTHGGTLGVSCNALRGKYPQLDIVAVSACQMIVVSALRDKSIVLAK